MTVAKSKSIYVYGVPDAVARMIITIGDSVEGHHLATCTLDFRSLYLNCQSLLLPAVVVVVVSNFARRAHSDPREIRDEL